MRFIVLTIVFLSFFSCKKTVPGDNDKLSSFSFDAVFKWTSNDDSMDTLEFKASCTVSCEGDSILLFDYAWNGKDSLGEPVFYNYTAYIDSGLSYLAIHSNDICYFSNEKVSVNYLFGSSPARHILNKNVWVNSALSEYLNENGRVDKLSDNVRAVLIETKDEEYKQKYFEEYTFKDQMPISYSFMQSSEFGDTIWEEIQYFNYKLNLPNVEEKVSPETLDYTMISFEDRYSSSKSFNKIPEDAYIGEYSGQNHRGQEITVDLSPDDTNVIVEYWYMGCGYCLKQIPMLSAKIDSLVNLGHKLKLHVVNSHDRPGKESVQNLLSKYGLQEKAIFIDRSYEKEKLNINVYPTVDVFKNGEIMKRFAGADNRALSYLDSIVESLPD